MMVMDKWREEHIRKALNNINQILKRAKNEDSTCACDVDACEKLSLYVDTWIRPELENALKKKRYGE